MINDFTQMICAEISFLPIHEEFGVVEKFRNKFFVVRKLPLTVLKTNVYAVKDVVRWAAQSIILKSTQVAGVPSNQVIKHNTWRGNVGGNLVCLLLLLRIIEIGRHFRLLLHNFKVFSFK